MLSVGGDSEKGEEPLLTRRRWSEHLEFGLRRLKIPTSFLAELKTLPPPRLFVTVTRRRLHGDKTNRLS